MIKKKENVIIMGGWNSHKIVNNKGNIRSVCTHIDEAAHGVVRDCPKIVMMESVYSR